MIERTSITEQGIILLNTSAITKSRRNIIILRNAGSFSRGHFVFQPEPERLDEALFKPSSIEADLYG